MSEDCQLLLLYLIWEKSLDATPINFDISLHRYSRFSYYLIGTVASNTDSVRCCSGVHLLHRFLGLVPEYGCRSNERDDGCSGEKKRKRFEKLRKIVRIEQKSPLVERM